MKVNVLLRSAQGFLMCLQPSSAASPRMTSTSKPMTPDRTLTMTLRAPSLSKPRAANVTPKNGMNGMFAFRLVEKGTPKVHPEKHCCH